MKFKHGMLQSTNLFEIDSKRIRNKRKKGVLKHEANIRYKVIYFPKLKAINHNHLGLLK